VAVPLLNLPLAITAEPSSQFSIAALLSALLLDIGLPFAVLATTAVVLQSWIANSQWSARHEPYWLYAASNAGSLLALLSYPLLMEPLMGLHMQAVLWTAGYLAYGLMVVAAWFVVRPQLRGAVPDRDVGTAPCPTASDYLLWLILSALPSALLLTVTNFIAIEIGSFPMVWVVPLALYLSSFIVAFRRRGHPRGVIAPFWTELVLIGCVLYLLPNRSWAAFAGHLAVFFLLCWFVHRELYERRPHPRHLTNFYLTVSAGGCLGGCLISLAAPMVFTDLYDYPLALLAIGGILLVCRGGDFLCFWRRARLPVAAARMTAFAACVVLIGIGVSAAVDPGEKFRHRNFYGTYRIVDKGPSADNPAGLRQLIHGSTMHGTQLLDSQEQHVPVSYFYEEGAIAQVYRSVPSPRRIAVLGLGAGIVAAYTQSEDSLTFYELDPDNESIARNWFTYLNDAPGQVQVLVGDGRLALAAHDPEDRYDLIHVDAFTGDGIPTHLLTREAIDNYCEHLAHDGLLLFHISNRYYDLRPVIKATAETLRLHGAMNVIDRHKSLKSFERPSQCVVLSRTRRTLSPLLAQGWRPFGTQDGLPSVRPWTDDYADLITPILLRLLLR